MMNADQFYEEFKLCLKYLGPGWFGKDKIKVWVAKKKFHMEVDGRKVSIDLPKKSPSKKARI